MTTSTNPNRGHYNPPPTVTHGTKSDPKPESNKAGKAGGESR